MILGFGATVWTKPCTFWLLAFFNSDTVAVIPFQTILETSIACNHEPVAMRLSAGAVHIGVGRSIRFLKVFEKFFEINRPIIVLVQCGENRFNFFDIGSSPQFFEQMSYFRLIKRSTVIDIKLAEQLLSKTHERVLVDFPPGNNWTVDRTSRWGSVGVLNSAARGHVFTQNENDIEWAGHDCSAINDPNSMAIDPQWVHGTNDLGFPGNTLNVNHLDDLLYSCPANQYPQDTPLSFGANYATGANPIGGETLLGTDSTGQYWREQERWCTRLILDFAATTRCPLYGRAVSGICQTAYELFWLNCGSSHVQPQTDSLFTSLVKVQVNAGPFPTVIQSMTPFNGMRVVDDSTPYCLGGASLGITGKMEEMAGLYVPIAQANLRPTTVCYDCCD